MARLNRALRVRSGEEPMVILTVGLMFLTWAGFTIGQSSIDALLFARYGVDDLPILYLLLGLLLFLASLGVTALLGQMTRRRLFVFMPIGLAILLIAGWLAVQAGIQVIYPALWLFVGLAFLVQSSYLWGIAGLVTDTRQAKRLFPLFGAGGIAGAALGGLLTPPLAAWLQPENLLLLWAATLVATSALANVVVVRWGSRKGREPRRRREGVTALRAIRNGYRTVRRSDLLRWMSAAAVLFSVLLYLLYLPFSRAAVERFPDAGELAGFLGVFSGISTGVALLVSVFAANRLFSRFGTPVVVLAYATAYAVGFAVLAVDSSFVLLVVVRFVLMVWTQGLGNSAWEAMINVTSPERRDHARVFLNGVPTQAGTVLAGIVLIVGQNAAPLQLYLVGFGAAILTMFAAWKAQRSYPAAVADTLRAGRPHVFEGYDEDTFAGIGEDAAAVSVVTAGLVDPDPRVRLVSAEVLGRLRNRDVVPMLRAVADDAAAEVRMTAVRALGRLGDPTVLPDVVQRLADADATVRLAAVQAVRAFDSPVAALDPLLDDADPEVRAEAAATMLKTNDAVRAREVLLAMSSNDNWSRRRIAVRALGSVGSGEACRLVAGRLGDPHPAVRAAAADELAGMDPAQAVPPLVKMLADSDFDTRDTAARALGRIGRPAVHAVAGALAFQEAESGALRALERLPTDGEAKRIRKYADETLQRALRDYRYAAQLIDRGNERQQLLRDSLRRCAERQALNAIRAVALVSPDRPMLVEAIGNLDGGDHTQRAAALELIDSSKEASSLRPLVAIWEESTASRSPLEDPILELRHHPDPWIRECAEFALMSAKEGQMAQTLPTLSVMERVLFLRKVPIFEGLPPEDLKPLAAIAEEHVHSDGDVIVAQGEAADEMHIIVSGVVSVIVNGQETARRGSGDVVGEMAIILEQPRTATLSAAGDVRLLTIGQQEFCGILRERPETNLAVMRVLARRLAES